MKKFLKIYKSSFPSVIGNIYYLWLKDGSSAVKIAFLGNKLENINNYVEKLYSSSKDFNVCAGKSEVIEKKIKAYLKGENDLNIDYLFLTGSDFEKKVWQATAEIEYGNVASYKEIAQRSGHSSAWRAAGTALGNNPIMLIIPCHRVIKSSGEIGRFGGGEDIKELLLRLEADCKYHIKPSY